MGLLLKHGARVNQKNKLGLTAVHLAAASGNLQALEARYNLFMSPLQFSCIYQYAIPSKRKLLLHFQVIVLSFFFFTVLRLQVLLLEEAECINSKTIMKETPLFFAAKNDHLDCAELLLSQGVNSEVLNLRLEQISLSFVSFNYII